MKNLLKRLMVFAISLPALIIILICLPQYNHLAFSMVVIIFSVLGAAEFSNILRLKNLPVSTLEAVLLGGISPVFTVLVVNFRGFGISHEFLALAFCLGASWVLVSRVFSSNEKLGSFVNRSAAGLAVLVYPGFFMSWIIALSVFPGAGFIILIFLLITLLNDAFAWLTGMLFGKNNRGIIAASPNKSIAGFIGGLLSSVALGILAAHFSPGDAFPSERLPWFVAGGLLGLGGGIAAVLGDLAESCLKRSAGIKDSGNAIPGRGGILDCIDSLALAAPLYYLIFRLLFTQGA
ncbi:MAG: phosphatidate cytidylyltransferase [Treponema sp.]|jgi:phosphatidate cytidylyltransferase|nr:phosphatidate cytidylyltransferase [Treponema sp.]